MKTNFSKQACLFSLIALFLFGVQGCKKNNPSPLEQLPAETQEGRNTFGCLVNGKAWKNGCNFLIFCSPTLDAYYRKGRLWISAKNLAGEAGKDKSYINITVENGVFSPGTFQLATSPESLGSYSLQKSCEYVTDDLNTGTLEITRLDTINFIVSGRFNFTAADPDCGSIAITDGRFDIKYE